MLNQLLKCDALRELLPFPQFKNLKNAHGGVLLLVNSTELHNASQIINKTSGTSFDEGCIAVNMSQLIDKKMITNVNRGGSRTAATSKMSTL